MAEIFTEGDGIQVVDELGRWSSARIESVLDGELESEEEGPGRFTNHRCEHWDGHLVKHILAIIHGWFEHSDSSSENISGQNISTDESMIKFKGRLGWIQYICKRKLIKWGMVIPLCEWETGHTINMKIYVLLLILALQDLLSKAEENGGIDRQRIDTIWVVQQKLPLQWLPSWCFVSS